ncbi:hypothetical protein [Streptomyces sp. OE57]|uniref:hypothetical protein n=1 Tax=Streptomyces lacaronensis TaxID=3379885 RepID=UPI0039B72628
MSICQKVARAWHRSRDRGGTEVPVGVVASLALLEQPEDGPDVTAHLLRFSPQQLVAHYRRVWAMLWLIRPELADWARPVRSWLEQSELGRERADAVHAVTQAAPTLAASSAPPMPGGWRTAARARYTSPWGRWLLSRWPPRPTSTAPTTVHC